MEPLISIPLYNKWIAVVTGYDTKYIFLLQIIDYQCICQLLFNFDVLYF